MIASKKKAPAPAPVVPPAPSVSVSAPRQSYETVQELVDGNPLADLYRNVAAILAAMPADPADPGGPRLFKTVKWNQGQLDRTRGSKRNGEYALAYPAALIHYVEVRWILGMNKVGQAYAKMRICYVLNRLNVGDDAFQCEGADVFKRIVDAINDGMGTLTPLASRFQLAYFDQPESFDSGLQQYWITYDVRCNDYTSYRLKDLVPFHAVEPPFTNFSDQDAQANPDGRPDALRTDEPASMEEP